MIQYTGQAGDVTVTHFPPSRMEGVPTDGMVDIEIPIDCESFLTMDMPNKRIIYGLTPAEARTLARLLLEAAEKSDHV